eukprot:Platyproteum_vivax@DN7545_c0_g1_i7.p1
MCSMKGFWMLEELMIETDPLFHLPIERLVNEFNRRKSSPKVNQWQSLPNCWHPQLLINAMLVFKNACEEDKDAKMFQWFCMWARIHPGLAVGWIVSELDPGAFVYGVCITNGGCQHPGPTKTPPALPIEDVATPELFAQYN